MVEFKAWPKIPRGSQETISITEKIDGTNACIIIEHGVIIGAQSRNRMLTDFTLFNGLIHGGDDNYGFAKWVIENQAELGKLGDGYHYGEWAGEGIQNNPHNIVGKKFFLFNSDRWRDGRQQRPAGVECVRILYEGEQHQHTIEDVMMLLKMTAEEAGYKPEGIVVWYRNAKRYEKFTFEFSKGKWCNDGDR